MTDRTRAVSQPHTEPAADEIRLNGGPFDGFNVPKPRGRWARVRVEDSDDRDLMHIYRPKRDGTWVYNGPDRILFRIPTGESE